MKLEHRTPWSLRLDRRRDTQWYPQFGTTELSTLDTPESHSDGPERFGNIVAVTILWIAFCALMLWTTPRPNADRCHLIEDAPARAGCYDRLNEQGQHPAKGRITADIFRFQRQ
jgi:hypothetical protein